MGRHGTGTNCHRGSGEECDRPPTTDHREFATCHDAAMGAMGRGGRLAQLVERLLYTQDVGGSSPSPPTSAQTGARVEDRRRGPVIGIPIRPRKGSGNRDWTLSRRIVARRVCFAKISGFALARLFSSGLQRIDMP